MTLGWTFNFFNSLVQLKDFNLLYGTCLLYIIILLIIIRHNHFIRLKLIRGKKLPDEDGAFEYGSSRFASLKEIKKDLKFGI